MEPLEEGEVDTKPQGRPISGGISKLPFTMEIGGVREGGETEVEGGHSKKVIREESTSLTSEGD